MTVKLTIHQPGCQTHDLRIDITDQCYFGRDSSCKICIQHTSISRFLAILSSEDGNYRIKDLESKNGTFVNDRRITQMFLKNRDCIRLGEFIKIVFEKDVLERQQLSMVDEDSLTSDISYIPADDLSESQIINLGAGDRSIDAFERAHKGLKALFRVTNALHISDSGHAVFQEILSSLNDAVRADRLFLLGYDVDRREIEIRHSLGPMPEGKVEFSRTILEETLAHHEVVLSRDCLVDERFALSGSIIGARIKSVICAPLQWEDELYGILYLDNRVETGAFTEEDARLVAAIARQASQTLRRQKLTRDIEDLFTSTIRTLVAALEVKDPYTCGHSERVTQISMQIARAVVPEATHRKNVELSALLHDVGKIGIPESVLHKNGKLNDEEFALIRNHPTMGSKIVGNIRNAEPIALGVRHHHERYDGTGYPDGLGGSHIPLIARIIAIADTFDAMTSTRPYRKALSVDQAMAEIAANAGTQFDPQLVSTFFEIVSRLDQSEMDSTSAISAAWLEEYRKNNTGLLREPAGS